MRYFGGKEGLLLEILKRHFEESRTTPLPYPPQDSLQAELSLYIRYGHENAKKHNEIYRIMLLRASIDLSVRRKVQALLPMDGDPKLLERISLLKSKGEIPANLDPKLAALVGFQNFTSVFIAGFLFDEAIQKEMQINLEKLVSTTVSGLIKF